MTNLAYKDDIILSKPPKYTCNIDREAVNMTKKKKSEIDYDNIKIIHTMADGTVRDSIKGYEMPYNDTTAIAYELLTKWTIEKQRKANK